MLASLQSGVIFSTLDMATGASLAVNAATSGLFDTTGGLVGGSCSLATNAAGVTGTSSGAASWTCAWEVMTAKGDTMKAARIAFLIRPSFCLAFMTCVYDLG
jgi:hypothetical protein